MRTGGGLYEIAQRTFWLEQLRRGRAFGGGSNGAQVVGEVPLIQILNPAASGVTIILHRVVIQTTTAQQVNLQLSNTALATLQQQGVNLRAGSAAGLGAVRTASAVGAPGTLVNFYLIPVSQAVDLAVESLVELDAGEGVVIAGQTANTVVGAQFFWVEL